MNATKTEFMLIGSRQRLNTLPRPPHLTIGGVPVNQVSTAKSFGVYIDENLSWGSHIEKLRKLPLVLALLNESALLFLLKL